MKRALIYYSLSDNTKEAAEKIADLLSADAYRVQLVKPMPATLQKQILKGGAQAVFGMKPKITGMPETISEYDEIILGTPIWAGLNASPLNTVMARKDVVEKTVAVFTLSGGGDNEGCMGKLNKILKNLKYSVALADRNHETAKDNDQKITDFAEQILKG